MASLEYILSQARMPLVVVTGGEPLRHANLVELVIALEKDGHVVQIETNGTIWNNELWEHTECMFVVSPKTTSIRKEYVSNRLCRVKFKQVMGEGAFPSQPNNKGGVPSIEPDYVMPLDSKDERGLTIHAKVCYDYVMNSDAILQLQIHKLIGAR
jgi:organic radical activating enzyme